MEIRAKRGCYHQDVVHLERSKGKLTFVCTGWIAPAVTALHAQAKNQDARHLPIPRQGPQVQV